MIKSSSILKINLKNLIKNYNYFKKINHNTIVAPTIKANAYGLGDIKIYKHLVQNKCKHFFVATIEEGIKLNNKNNKISIFVLNGIQNYDLKLFTKYKLIPIINTTAELRKIIKTNISFGIHIDTGINRLGICYKEFSTFNFKSNNIKIVISHLASADERQNKFNKVQNKRYLNIINKFNIENVFFSLANTNGSVLSKKYLYNIIRPGIGLYGGNNKNQLLKKKLKPVLRFSGKIIQIKNIYKNEFIGYNQTYKTKKKIKVAIIGTGYADGIPRNLSNKGRVYYKNEKYKIIGRVSMDSITINISNSRHNLKVGFYIDFINNKYDIENFAVQCNTISNEIITSIGARVKRIYE